MKLTKEDYMRLPKERLAELLAEQDNEREVEPITIPPIAPYAPLNDNDIYIYCGQSNATLK